jgi:hypothetical protein
MESLSVLQIILLMAIGGPLGLIVGSLIGALILIAACAFCNVENLRFLKAIGLVLLITFVNALLCVGTYFVIGLSGQALGFQPDTVQILVGLVALPLVLLATATILWLLLPVAYHRGILIALMNLGITLVIAGVLGGLTMVTLAGVQIATAAP